jgi:hypothetical protein
MAVWIASSSSISSVYLGIQPYPCEETISYSLIPKVKEHSEANRYGQIKGMLEE